MHHRKPDYLWVSPVTDMFAPYPQIKELRGQAQATDVTPLCPEEYWMDIVATLYIPVPNEAFMQPQILPLQILTTPSVTILLFQSQQILG